MADRIWLVIDDVHELDSAQALRQLELLVLRAPPQLRFVLVTRHDLRLGLHRLRLEGELTEIRAADLRFTMAQARELFSAAGVELTEPALGMLVERTEGWAAGLRLAALSLAGRGNPERFAAEFSGSERTVADYLLAEVLDRQSEAVRRLLLSTSVLDRVSGELADLLTRSPPTDTDDAPAAWPIRLRTSSPISSMRSAWTVMISEPAATPASSDPAISMCSASSRFAMSRRPGSSAAAYARAASSVSSRSTCGFRNTRSAAGGWPGSRPAMTALRATVYFSPVSAIRARTCFLNALSSVTPCPRGDAAPRPDRLPQR
jgi:hypothetical protein